MPPRVVPRRRPHRRPGSKDGPPENPNLSKLRDRPRANTDIACPKTRRNSWSDSPAPALRVTGGPNNCHGSAIDNDSDGEFCTGETLTFGRGPIKAPPHSPSQPSGLSMIFGNLPTTQKPTPTVDGLRHMAPNRAEDRGSPWIKFWDKSGKKTPEQYAIEEGKLLNCTCLSLEELNTMEQW